MRTRQHPASLGFIETTLFILLWMVILLSPLLNRGESDGIDWNQLQIHWTRMSPFLIISLVNHYLLVPFLFFRKKKMVYLVSIAGMVIIFFLMVSSIDALQDRPVRPPTPPRREMGPPSDNRPPRDQQQRRPPPRPERAQGLFPPRLNFLLIALTVLGFDTGLRSAFRWAKTDQEKLRLEKENVNNQLAMLRNQVNPHFFMNTLNNIHALIDISTDEAKEAVIRLSKLMRHLLYDSDIELNPISKELEFVESYIDLMRLRYSEKVKISLQIPDVVPAKKIPPLLFTSLLENAFKHGISYSTESFVQTRIDFSDSQLEFQVRNSKTAKNEEEFPQGIGIENTRKRLDLLYKDRYKLDFVETENEFSVNLTIPL